MMKIRELRMKKGLSQKEVSALLMIPPNTFNQWEKEKRQPDINMLIKLADFFEVSVDYLIGRDPSYSEIPVAARSGASGVATSTSSDEEKLAALDEELPGISTPVEPEEF